MTGDHRQERAVDPSQPRPIKVWVVANKPYTGVKVANRAAIRVSRERQQPVKVFKLTIDPIASNVQRTGLHEVTAVVDESHS